MARYDGCKVLSIPPHLLLGLSSLLVLLKPSGRGETMSPLRASASTGSPLSSAPEEAPDLGGGARDRLGERRPAEPVSIAPSVNRSEELRGRKGSCSKRPERRSQNKMYCVLYVVLGIVSIVWYVLRAVTVC